MTGPSVPSSDVSLESLDIEAIRSRIKELTEAKNSLLDYPEDLSSGSRQILEDCLLELQNKCKQIEEEDLSVDALCAEDLETYLECLKKELHSIEEESKKLSDEIGPLSVTITEDSARLDTDLEALDLSLKLSNFQGTNYCQAGNLHGRSENEALQTCPSYDAKDHKLEMLKLDNLVEKSKIELESLMDLEHALKRTEAVEKVEDIFSDIKVIDFEGNCIRLLLKAPVKVLDDVLLQQKLSLSDEGFLSDHELLIEVIDGTVEIKNVKIFPADVYLDEVIHAAKSSRNRNSLGWLVRQVQQRILLCTLRHAVVKDVNRSRHSTEYCDRDETITAHLVGGVDAYLKIPQGWPILNCGLELVSIMDVQLKSISLSILCKVKELANSLDKQIRQHLAGFVNGIEEILVREIQSELKTSQLPG